MQGLEFGGRRADPAQSHDKAPPSHIDLQTSTISASHRILLQTRTCLPHNTFKTSLSLLSRLLGISPIMPVFPTRRYRPASHANTLPAKYRAALAKHPFALFGLPFIATMVLGSFFLTPATALRYERHDRKVRQLTKEEELGIGKDKRKIDLREEYYVGAVLSFPE